MKYTVRTRGVEFPTFRSTTTRVCRHEGCEGQATYVDGYYMAGGNRVRVWACLDHWAGDGSLVLPTPKWILNAEKIAAEEEAKIAKKVRYAPEERGVSIKTLAPSGHGPSIPNDRVLAWRWGGY